MSEQQSALKKDKKRTFRFGLILFGVLLVFVMSIMMGRYPKPYFTSPATFINDDLALNLAINLRLPRILMAFIMGMVLSASGTVLQMVFRNPLVDSGFLGVSQGAGFGASLAIVFLGANPFYIQGLAAGFAFLGLGTSYFIARRFRFGDWVLRLILAGVAISAFYSAGSGIIKYLADPLTELPDITFWLMGGLWAITWEDIWQILPVVIPAITVIYLMRWRLNLLSLRDETAFSLGAVPSRERIILLIAAVSATAVIVSKAGLVGWIGLIMPHAARLIFGSDAQRVLPGSMLLGGIFTLLCDDVARTLLSGEIPLGIITSLIGTMIFLAILMRTKATFTK
ncbi:MAG: iron ABC transporter permease [Anaerolineaceae bacterium]|nr:iron ABC transporter permease [Anaerolineaceae bacterium]